MLTGHQLWDEGEMGDLGGGPAKLEDDDEGDEIGETHPVWGVHVTTQAWVEDEGEGNKHAKGP